MKQSKISLLILCIVSIFLFVYGTAGIFRLILGKFLLDGGFANVNYAILALLCAAPFMFYILFTSSTLEQMRGLIVTSGAFFIVLFIYVNIMLVNSLIEAHPETTTRLLTVFPATAIILVFVLSFAQKRNVWWKECINKRFNIEKHVTSSEVMCFLHFFNTMQYSSMIQFR